MVVLVRTHSGLKVGDESVEGGEFPRDVDHGMGPELAQPFACLVERGGTVLRDAVIRVSRPELDVQPVSVELKADLVGNPKRVTQHVEQRQELVPHVFGVTQAVEQYVGVRHEEGSVP